MHSVDREIARTIRDARVFLFQCPKQGSEKVYRLKVLRCYGVLVWAFVLLVVSILGYGLLTDHGF